MLNKSFSATILIVLLSALAYGLQETVTWPAFDSPEGRFSVVMPTKPAPEVKDVDSAVGKLTLYTYQSSSKGAHFMVSFGDYPTETTDAAQMERVLDGVRQGVLKGLNAELISENRITMKGHPGREFKARRTMEGSEVVFSWKMLLRGRRLYQLAAVTAKADAESPDISRFLTSFQLLN